MLSTTNSLNINNDATREWESTSYHQAVTVLVSILGLAIILIMAIGFHRLLSTIRKAR